MRSPWLPVALSAVRPQALFDAAWSLINEIFLPGVDELTIISILTNRSNEQRQDIAFAYQRRAKKVTSPRI
ncbi:hypothetical protein FKM82_029574 [Ascaphus truei]